MYEHTRGTGWRRVTVDDLICDGPCLLYSASGYNSVTGTIATLYDAQGAVTGREICTFAGIANTRVPVEWNPPLRLSQGLYVDMLTNGVEILVQYEEIEHDTANREPHAPEV